MDLLEHEIRVTFRFPVYFSRDVFASSNPLVLKAAPSAVAPKPARILFVVDGGVAAAHPRCCDRSRSTAAIMRARSSCRAERDRHPRRRAGQERSRAPCSRCCRRSMPPRSIGTRMSRRSAAARCSTSSATRRRWRIAASGSSAFPPRCWRKTTRRSASRTASTRSARRTISAPSRRLCRRQRLGFLTTLADRDWRGGLSEAIKAALIKDHTFFEFIEEQAARSRARDLSAMEQVVRRSAALHLHHIATARRSVREGLVTAAGLRPLGGAQAGAADQPSVAARRSGRHRARARHDLFAPVWISCRRATGAGSSTCFATRPASTHRS